MNDNTLSLLAGLVGPCPECHNGILQAVFDGEQTNFLCSTCGCCWHAELDWVNRVSPWSCPGCSARAVCTNARRAYGAPVAPAG